MVTDRDLRAHVGYLERTKVNGAMTEKVRTVSPSITLEEAAQILPQISDRRLARG